MDGLDLGMVRNASLLIGIVNILQPVSRARLLEEFGERSSEELDVTIEFLVERRLLKALPGDFFRTTWKGQQSIWSKSLARQRDVRRFWYLSELSDRIRRKPSKEGGAS